MGARHEAGPRSHGRDGGRTRRAVVVQVGKGSQAACGNRTAVERSFERVLTRAVDSTFGWAGTDTDDVGVRGWGRHIPTVARTAGATTRHLRHPTAVDGNHATAVDVHDRTSLDHHDPTTACIDGTADHGALDRGLYRRQLHRTR
jgi:hypothetical protein